MVKDSVAGVPTVSWPSTDRARGGRVQGAALGCAVPAFAGLRESAPAALRAAKMLGSGWPHPGAGPLRLCGGLVFTRRCRAGIGMGHLQVSQSSCCFLPIPLFLGSRGPGNAVVMWGLTCLRDLLSLPAAVHGQLAAFRHFSPSSIGHSIFNKNKKQPLK